MSRLDSNRYQFIRTVITAHYDHLRTRNHNIANLHFRNLQYPFDHALRISIEQTMALCFTQYTYQPLTGFRLSQQGLTKPVHP